MLAIQRRGTGHWGKPYALRGLKDAYCDIGYYYDPNVDDCVPMQENSSVCDIGWYWDSALESCQPSGGGTSGGVIPTDGGNPQIWQSIISGITSVGTLLLKATGTQYQTRYGTYAYGTGPYTGLTPTLASQYLARQSIGGLSTTTWLLIGGGLLFAVMMMKR
jgi:hypothetical protein